MLVYFLGFLGGIALFMYGMQLMGDGLQKAAGESPVLSAEIKTESFGEKEKSLYSKNLPGLFTDEEMVLDEILSTEPENVTPMQALELVARWKKTLSGR